MKIEVSIDQLKNVIKEVHVLVGDQPVKVPLNKLTRTEAGAVVKEIARLTMKDLSLNGAGPKSSKNATKKPAKNATKKPAKSTAKEPAKNATKEPDKDRASLHVSYLFANYSPFNDGALPYVSYKDEKVVNFFQKRGSALSILYQTAYIVYRSSVCIYEQPDKLSENPYAHFFSLDYIEKEIDSEFGPFSQDTSFFKDNFTKKMKMDKTNSSYRPYFHVIGDTIALSKEGRELVEQRILLVVTGYTSSVT